MIEKAEIAARPPVEWRVSSSPVDYEQAVAEMESRAALIRAGTGAEQVWLLEHPPLYTAGTSADPAELLDTGGLPVYATGRGGRVTWHGPGQRVAYVMMDLKERGADVRAFVADLERWVIAALARFGVAAGTREGRIGIWVERPGGREEKIAAIGVRIRRWVSYHGVAVNVDPDLGHYAGIVPCGITEHGVTSLAALGVAASMADVDEALLAAFTEVFGREVATAPSAEP